MNTRLFIENREIELDETVQFAITKQFEDLSNPTTIINDWSKTVSIPFTARNNGIFGHIYNPDKLTVEGGSNQPLTGNYFNPYKKLDMRLQWGDDVLMVGYAKMNEVKQNNGKGTYELTLFGQLGKVFQEMQKITFDTTTDNTDYLIHGEEYVSENINRNLVFRSWNTSGQRSKKVLKKGETGYQITDIIGFAPNNSFSEGFNYDTYQDSNNSSNLFVDNLQNADFQTKTGIEPSAVIHNGVLPREIGEYRSYLQLPYIYWNKLFQIFQKKAEEVTGYKFKLDGTWFNSSNPYWYNLVYMLKPFNTKKTEGATNYYNPHIYNFTWMGKTDTNIHESYVMIPTTTETFKLVEDFDAYPSRFVITDKDEVYVNYSLGLELHDNGSSNPYSLRLHKDNYVNIKVDLLDSSNNIIKTEKYAICDYECSYMDEIKNTYKQENILTYNELTRTGEYPHRLRYIIINPTFTYMLKSYKGLEYKFRISSNWKYGTYRFMTKYKSSDSYVGTTPETVLKYSNNSLISAQLSLERRSNSYFILNDLWNNEYNIFNEVLKYCKKFRLMFREDVFNKQIEILTFSTYFKKYSVTDWTNKIDKSKDFNIKPISFENKYVLFNHKDSNTKLGKQYKEKYGLNYGDYRIVTDYNFNTKTNKLFDGITPSITNTDNILSWTNLRNYFNIVYSFPSEIYVYNKDKDNKQVDIFGAYFFHNGLTTFSKEQALHLHDVCISDDTAYQDDINTYFYSRNFNSVSVESYPNLDIVKGDFINTFNLPKENYTYNNNYDNKAGIYSNFWEKYIDERYNIQNKIITCYVLIKPSEYNQFEWNKLVKVGNQLCIVNKIYDYNITSNQPTKVDLVTIQDINAYTDDSYFDALDKLDLHVPEKSYFNSSIMNEPRILGTFDAVTDVTFANASKTYIANNVKFTIIDDTIYYQTIAEYLDKEDIEFTVTLRNENYTASFNCVRYSTYPYPWIIIEDSNGKEVSSIYPGSRVYKFKWHGTETEGLDNKPTITIENHGTGSATIGNDWVENWIMIQEGDDEWFRNEYEVTLNTNMTNYSGTYLRFIVTDKAGWHETRDYPISI
jgi:mRNA-degrading endonuclease RelE of RelBE toxin-antitoxin system